MKARILFLAAALTLAALPARAQEQTELQGLWEWETERAREYASEASKHALDAQHGENVAKWLYAAQAWEAVAEAKSKEERVRLKQAAFRANRAAWRTLRMKTQPLRNAVARAYWAQVGAWDAEADFDFVEYDGADSDKRAKAAGARINASRAAEDASFAQAQASRANLHALRARENASDWRRVAGRETGGLKELANKAAAAWESAAQAWEAVGE